MWQRQTVMWQRQTVMWQRQTVIVAAAVALAAAASRAVSASFFAASAVGPDAAIDDSDGRIFPVRVVVGVSVFTTLSMSCAFRCRTTRLFVPIGS